MGESDQNELEKLRAENAALKAGKGREQRLQVSQKGGVSLYGIRRFPITFYKEEWDQILAKADEIKRFIQENDSQLKKRD